MPVTISNSASPAADTPQDLHGREQPPSDGQPEAASDSDDPDDPDYDPQADTPAHSDADAQGYSNADAQSDARTESEADTDADDDEQDDRVRYYMADLEDKVKKARNKGVTVGIFPALLAPRAATVDWFRAWESASRRDCTACQKKGLKCERTNLSTYKCYQCFCSNRDCSIAKSKYLSTPSVLC